MYNWEFDWFQLIIFLMLKPDLGNFPFMDKIYPFNVLLTQCTPWWNRSYGTPRRIFGFYRNSRKNLDPKDYLIEQLTSDVACKLPGSVKGEQFIIQNCSHSLIYVLDYCDSVLVDECDHCKIIIGPTKGRWLIVCFVTKLFFFHMSPSYCE